MDYSRHLIWRGSDFDKEQQAELAEASSAAEQLNRSTALTKMPGSGSRDSPVVSSIAPSEGSVLKKHPSGQTGKKPLVSKEYPDPDTIGCQCQSGTPTCLPHLFAKVADHRTVDAKVVPKWDTHWVPAALLR